MTDDYDPSDDYENYDPEDYPDSTVPVSNEPPIPESDTQEEPVQPEAPSEEQSQYRNPMLDAPQPGPGSHLLTNILAYAREKFGLSNASTPAPQEAIPTSPVSEGASETPLDAPTEKPPTEFGPEAKKYVEEGKNKFNFLTGGAAAATPATKSAVEYTTDPQGQMPPPERAMKTIERGLEKAGMDGALGFLQRYRRDYDSYRAIGDVALEHGNLITAIDAANHAYQNVPGFNNVTFTQGRNGTVTGLVTGPDGNTESYAIPVNRFQQLLKNGEFDELLEKGNAASVEALGMKFKPPPPSPQEERNAAGMRMVEAPKIIKRKTEAELDREERAASRADDQAAKERLLRIQGENAVARERARTEGYEKTRTIQAEGKIKEAEIKAAAKNKDLETQLQQNVNDILKKNPQITVREIESYKKRFRDINGMEQPQQTAPTPTQQPAGPGKWQFNPAGTTPRDQWRWVPATQ